MGDSYSFDWGGPRRPAGAAVRVQRNSRLGVRPDAGEILRRALRKTSRPLQLPEPRLPDRPGTMPGPAPWPAGGFAASRRPPPSPMAPPRMPGPWPGGPAPGPRAPFLARPLDLRERVQAQCGAAPFLWHPEEEGKKHAETPLDRLDERQRRDWVMKHLVLKRKS